MIPQEVNTLSLLSFESRYGERKTLVGHRKKDGCTRLRELYVQHVDASPTD